MTVWGCRRVGALSSRSLSHRTEPHNNFCDLVTSIVDRVLLLSSHSSLACEEEGEGKASVDWSKEYEEEEEGLEGGRG